MSKVIGVKVKKYDPISYYVTDDYRANIDTWVVVETQLGLEFAKVLLVDNAENSKFKEGL